MYKYFVVLKYCFSIEKYLEEREIYILGFIIMSGFG